MLVEGRSQNIYSRRHKPECIKISICPTTHMIISDNSLESVNNFDSNIIQNGTARILRRFKMDSFEADVVRSQMFTSSRREMSISSITDVICYKFSHGTALHTLSGENVNILLEFCIFSNREL